MEYEDPVIENIMTRRSVRDYLSKPVSEGTIEEIIEAGIHSPTGMGIQPWRFIVVRNRKLLKRISDYSKSIALNSLEGMDDETMEGLQRMLSSEEFNIFYNAPTLIIVAGLKEDQMSDYDCSLCAENMMLAAHAMGLGSCWIGFSLFVQQSPELMAELGIGEEYKIVAPIIFGYPRTVLEKSERREPVISWID